MGWIIHQEQREIARQEFGNRGLNRALLACPATVKWLTGFAPPIELGPHPFAGGPSLLYFSAGRFTLLVVDAFEGLARIAIGDGSDCTVVSYPGYAFESPIDGHGGLYDALRGLLLDGVSGPTGLETHDLPCYLFDLVAQPTEIDGWAVRHRMIKTRDELRKLRANFLLSDLGQAAGREAVVEGNREIDVYLAVHDAICRMVGERVPIGNDFVVGSRQNNIGGWPKDLVIKQSDSFIVDVSTLRYGYWSDSCGTYFAGDPTEKQRTMHETALKALETGASLLRPGAVAKDVDRAMRAVIEDAGYPVYPHHSGHGVGVSGHEAPRIVPYSDEVLQPGMVILLEPGIYFPGETAVRLEDAFLVQDGPPAQLTHHDKEL